MHNVIQAFKIRVHTIKNYFISADDKEACKISQHLIISQGLEVLSLYDLISLLSDFIWDFRNLPFPSHLGKYFIKIEKISVKKHETGKIKTIFELGMTAI